MTDSAATATLSRRQRWTVLFAAFLAWTFAGWVISLYSLVGRSAAIDVLGLHEAIKTSAEAKTVVANWFNAFACAFLLGAAAGGWLFGWFGDRFGRRPALGLSVICYSVFSGLGAFVADPYALVALRFVACLGVGGAWPNAVSLATEALPEVPKATLAGFLGAAANFGFVALGFLAIWKPVSPTDWRWTAALSAAPAVLGVFCLRCVPESPKWLAAQNGAPAGDGGLLVDVFRPPLLWRTALAIILAGVPVVGTAVSANWLQPWTDAVAPQDPHLKAWTQVTRSTGAAIGSFLGGWIAGLAGRRLSYALMCVATFAVSEFIFLGLIPSDGAFFPMVFVLGFVGVTFFGWLPLCLPEFFPTRVRATGMGVAFNSGRIVAAAVAVAATGIIAATGGNFPKVGAATSAIYLVGLIAIWWLPDSGKTTGNSTSRAR